MKSTAISLDKTSHHQLPQHAIHALICCQMFIANSKVHSLPTGHRHGTEPGVDKSHVQGSKTTHPEPQSLAPNPFISCHEPSPTPLSNIEVGRANEWWSLSNYIYRKRRRCKPRTNCVGSSMDYLQMQVYPVVYRMDIMDINDDESRS